VTNSPAPAPNSSRRDGPLGPAGRSRRRLVLWLSVAGGCVAAALIAVFAISPQQAAVAGASPLIGRPAPATAGTLISQSGPTSLSALSGKWVVVNFFASWCPPCATEMPALEQFQEAHTTAGDATVFGVEEDPTDAGAAKGWLSGRSADWPAINDPSADVAWGVNNPPETYLVSPSGIVLEKWFGAITEAKLDAAISSYSQAAGG
jgi:cytochrome c biogenesis protein CcmG, thiol:disulfide interchange protein DsbE